MKTVACFLLVLLSRQAICGIIRNPPAFAKPVYSDSYLPAAMQVIFHAVEQLKALQAEEAIQTSTLALVLQDVQTSSNVPTPSVALNGTGIDEEESKTKGPENDLKDKLEEPKVEKVEDSKESIEGNDEPESVEPSEIVGQVHQEAPEINEETPETNYATPETNYETPEEVHAVQESNQEFMEENHETETMSTTVANEVKEKKKEPTIDSIVHDVYQIVKPTTSKFIDEEKSAGDFVEKIESVEEEEDENRFTRLGEKVTQVPRPSLSSYLKRAKVPMSATLLQLANLYDSLSKDARKQGFGKYTGYSDEVLNTLQTSAEGGIGPQMKKILGKVLERNELTRDDAKLRTNQTIRDLDNTSSDISKELRPLLPLRYSP
ncbi:uncharacterized protein LOC108632847 [Ceratina calcarata]|uniref:Uncharacterized protein LOC108632847 n=1 Tax=Ceratina calcarata TaxID=156304 RepID=A0AAJ7NGF8_9HYME|nr:uncharacterized protein LOC108632847 [Ceratina calcarata]